MGDGKDDDGQPEPSSFEPSLVYRGTEGWSGTETSRDRAEEEVRTGRATDRQRFTLLVLAQAGARGVTSAECRHRWPRSPDGRKEWHHGSWSSSLTNLHKDGRIARLVETRDKCHIYVHWAYVNERPLLPPKERE